MAQEALQLRLLEKSEKTKGHKALSNPTLYNNKIPMKSILNTRKKINSRVYTALAIVMTLGIMGVLIYREKGIIFSYSWKITPSWILISFALFTVNFFLVSLVWTEIIANLGHKVSFSDHLRNYAISNLMRRLPGTVWYIAWRAKAYDKDGIPYQITSIGSGVELVINNISCIVIALLLSFKPLINHPLGIAGAILLLSISLLLLQPPVINWIFTKLKVEYKTIDYKVFIKWIAIYLFTRIVGGTILYAIGNVLTQIPIDQIWIIIGFHSLVGFLSSLLFFSPTNLGFSEVSISLLLSTILPSSVAVIIALANRLLVMIFEAFWAVILIIVERKTTV